MQLRLIVEDKHIQVSLTRQEELRIQIKVNMALENKKRDLLSPALLIMSDRVKKIFILELRFVERSQRKAGFG